ncbi:MAG TPA: hypothetical protein VF258_02825 [Luteolibacter sp.]
MKILFSALFTASLVGCALESSAVKEEFVATPSMIDERIETASIEDYVVALPPFAYHESSVEQFVEQVRTARGRQTENRGKGLDYLFVNGDGCWPSKDFVLDRDRSSLKVRVYQWEPGIKDYTETMRRVPGGWMRGPRVEIKTAEQVVTH